MELTTPTAEAMHKLDPDGDGTINWKEAYKASAKHFEVADLDHDGTLDQKEAAATGISAAEFQKADIDQTAPWTRKNTPRLSNHASSPPTPTRTAPSPPRSWAHPRARRFSRS